MQIQDFFQVFQFLLTDVSAKKQQYSCVLVRDSSRVYLRWWHQKGPADSNFLVLIRIDFE